MKAVFVELPAFQRYRASYLDDDGFLALQNLLMKNPERMKTIVKTAPKRDLFVELSEGVAALSEARQGKRTLRTHALAYKPAPKVTPKELIRLRESLKLSRALFAVYLRTNVRTLENWEQGRARPNAQAALLINLVKRYPDTIERLAAI